jgi:hypothetical protein
MYLHLLNLRLMLLQLETSHPRQTNQWQMKHSNNSRKHQSRNLRLERRPRRPHTDFIQTPHLMLFHPQSRLNSSRLKLLGSKRMKISWNSRLSRMS